MFFVLSKILSFLVDPLSWILIILVVAFFIKKESLKRLLRITAISLTLFFSSPLILNLVNNYWSMKQISVSEVTKTYDVAIILGGFLETDIYNLNEFKLSNSADRLAKTMELYKMGKVKKILISSGSGLILYPGYKEGLVAKKFLIQMGFPEQDVWVETVSRNTHENAIESKKILEQNNAMNNLLLITSAYHMPRALACFKKEGIDPDCFAVDGISGNGIDWKNPVEYLIPSSACFYRWEQLLHEFMGYMSYKLVAYI